MLRPRLDPVLSSADYYAQALADPADRIKREMENAFEERIKHLTDQHQIELEELRNTYSQNMLHAASKYSE